MARRKLVDMDKVKTRKFVLLLYPDSESYDCGKVLEYMRMNYETAYILHDKDRWTKEDEQENPEHKDGELKKPHYHVVLRWVGKSARYRGGLAKELNIPKEACEPILAEDCDGALLYLVHAGEKEKYQYTLEEVKGSLKSKLSDLLNFSQEEKPEGEQLQDIMCFILQEQNKLYTHELIEYCIVSKYLKAYRKYSYQIHRVLDEHNNRCYYAEMARLKKIRNDKLTTHFADVEIFKQCEDYEQIELMFEKNLDNGKKM